MKPLIVMIAFNRMRETEATLESLAETTDLAEVALVIVDNGSTDGTREAIEEWWSHYWIPSGAIYCLDENIGCPRALNKALELRDDGQPFVKIDNDVAILTEGWVGLVEDLVLTRQENEKHVAMVGAYYPGVNYTREIRQESWKNLPLYHVTPVIGHTVWHTGEFMDRVGYFDVLTPDHLYGFEDLIMSHKANVMKWELLYWEGWQIRNLQRKNSLGDKRDAHVDKIRPLYKERVAQLWRGGLLYTGPEGAPTRG